MPGSSSRRRQSAINYWPGFVDALAALLVVVVFLIMVFAIAQFFLSDALSGRDDALSKLNRQVDELARMLDLERSANTELRLSVSQLSAQLQSSISDRDSLTSRLTFIEGMLESARQENAEQLATLRTQVTADQETIESQRRDLAQLEADIEDRNNRLTEIAQRAETAETSFLEQTEISQKAQDQVALLNQQLAALRNQLAALNDALEASEVKNREQEVQIVNLGSRLNEALATKVQELARYRSEFFGRLREVLGDRTDIRIEGDRFVFQSEVLFGSGQAVLNPEGEGQLQQLAEALVQIAADIPDDIEWILRVDGHTDERPISTARFPSNWELASARAISVVKFLVQSGIPPENLVAAGFGQFQPIDGRQDEIAYRRNRRIEFKLDQR
ncbi:MAG: peptidoglycan -binding protein [Rhodospirillaceae bacterium]|nr:peptidoglycan -binding protein [Rhodospirillaceae bacterium]MBT4772134.1 peptidoglycan -binding protein [Rhodospirillaceae bacterium]MBT5359421.1 peptidoglycan -binding protein [Rhodospirillaceae bacterium]MBT5768386.1 peptidoglycan -binding protein [Rhodospirillaceae bacterium]MBT6309583.1 peptidoglycan -binding protein [Rhodospirillaceae bacterium]